MEFVQKTRMTDTAIVMPSANIRKKDTRKKYCSRTATAVHRIYNSVTVTIVRLTLRDCFNRCLKDRDLPYAGSAPLLEEIQSGLL